MNRYRNIDRASNLKTVYLARKGHWTLSVWLTSEILKERVSRKKTMDKVGGSGWRGSEIISARGGSNEWLMLGVRTCSEARPSGTRRGAGGARGGGGRSALFMSAMGPRLSTTPHVIARPSVSPSGAPYIFMHAQCALGAYNSRARCPFYGQTTRVFGPPLSRVLIVDFSLLIPQFYVFFGWNF